MIHTKENNVAIVIFANSANKDVESKGIIGGENLFDELNKDVIRKAKNTKLPYFIFSEKRQRGNTFGKRFCNALSDVFNLGFNSLIIVGNDSPQLTKTNILVSAQKTSKNKIVLGPSRDGGFYLLGIHKSNFDVSCYESFSWQTSKLNKEISSWANKNNYLLSKLNVLQDVDSTEDIQFLRHNTKCIGYRIQLCLLKIQCTHFQYFISKIPFSIKIFVFNISFNKGSPKLASF